MPTLTRYAEIARDAGRSTVIYPEGSRHKGTKREDEIARDFVKPGALKIASDLGMQVRPAGTVLRDRGHNLVHFDEPFDPYGVCTEELADRLQTVLDRATFEANKLWGEA
jgi:1-acyl-sn-glycerol-3-phosphate acyltransferase